MGSNRDLEGGTVGTVPVAPQTTEVRFLLVDSHLEALVQQALGADEATRAGTCHPQRLIAARGASPTTHSGSIPITATRLTRPCAGTVVDGCGTPSLSSGTAASPTRPMPSMKVAERPHPPSLLLFHSLRRVWAGANSCRPRSNERNRPNDFVASHQLLVAGETATRARQRCMSPRRCSG